MKNYTISIPSSVKQQHMREVAEVLHHYQLHGNDMPLAAISELYLLVTDRKYKPNWFDGKLFKSSPPIIGVLYADREID